MPKNQMNHSCDRQLFDELSKHPFFFNIPYSLLEPLLPKCGLLSLKKDTVLLREGQENHNLYLLLEGRIKVHLEAIDSRKGILISPGECVGEISIIDGKSVSAHVVAETPCRLLVIPDQLLWTGFILIPEFARNLMRQIAMRFRKHNHIIRTALEQKLQLEQIKKELEIARSIQAGMLPTLKPFLPGHPQVEVAAVMNPAKEVGGDFYDTFSLDQRHIYIAVGDVSGKGISAALFMVRVLTLLRSEIIRNRNLPNVIQHINRLLCEDNAACMFVTMIIFVLDVVTGDYTLVNGGHCRPLLKKKDTPYQYIELPKGILLGLQEKAEYEPIRGKLSHGDELLVFTDGVTEATNINDEIYTDENLLACVNKQVRKTPELLLNSIVNEIESFTGSRKQFDDITMIALRYNG